LLEPKPVQRPYPPIWVGGSNNAHLLDTLPRYRAGIERLRRGTEAAGRPREAG